MKKTKLTHRPRALEIPKRLCIAGLAAAGMSLGIAPASATVSCSGSGISPEHGTNVSGQAQFTLDTSASPKTLTLILKNTTYETTGVSTQHPGDVLSGVLFKIGTTSGILKYSATANPVLGPASELWTSGSGHTTTGPLNNASGSSWTSTLTTFTYGNYGVATTGWGLFQGSSIKLGKPNPDYGIITEKTFPGSIGGSQFPYIQDSLKFVFTTASSFSESDISSVRFMFGTDGTIAAPFQSTCISKDYGDAPDTATNPSSGPNNYQTTAADGGPSHKLGAKVWLGSANSDGDSGSLQNDPANSDNITGVNDEDGIPVLPTILTAAPSVNMTVNASNTSGSDAFMSCWIDFNKNGLFENAHGEKATANPVTIPTGSSNTPFPLAFTGYTATAGNTYIRCRIASASGEVDKSIGAAATGEVEDYRVTVTAGGGVVLPYADFGDAPDAGPGTGPGNYSTQDFGTPGNIGANNEISPAILLGTAITDEDNGTLNNTGATADNDTDTNDEDGVTQAELPVMSATSTSTKLKIKATNTIPGGPGVYLACWIDFDRDGNFGNNPNELATALVPNGTINGTFPLSYAHSKMGTNGGNTYMRCRIDSSWTSSGMATSINPGSLGEVEDYFVKVLPPCTVSAITTVAQDVAIPPTYLSGITFTVFPGSPLNGTIKSIQCPKTDNIDPVTGMSFNPVPDNYSAPTTGLLATPATWTYIPPITSSVQLTARRTVAGTATLGCTVTDTATPTANECVMDPVIVEAIRLKGQPLTIEILDEGRPLSADFQYVKIINGSATDAGATQVEINVNGTKFKQTSMKTNEAYFLNIGSALKTQYPNSVTVTVKGMPNSLATVMFSDEPIL